MTRLLAASLFLAVVAAPAFACELEKSVSTDTHARTVASQPAGDHANHPANTAGDRKS